MERGKEIGGKRKEEGGSESQEVSRE